MCHVVRLAHVTALDGQDVAKNLVLLAGTFAWRICLSGRGIWGLGVAACCRDTEGEGTVEPSSSNGDNSGMPSEDASHRVWVDVDQAQAALRCVAEAEAPSKGCTVPTVVQRAALVCWPPLMLWADTNHSRSSLIQLWEG